MNSIRSALRPLLVIVAALAIVVQPSPVSSLAAGILVTLVAISALVVVGGAVSALSGSSHQSRMRTVLDELVPWSAQSDPDARGHARPRAPGLPLTAV